MVVLGLALLANAAELSTLLKKDGAVRTETVFLADLSAQNQYSLLYSIGTLRQLTPESRVQVEVRQDGALLASKTLHLGDPDYYTQARPPSKLRLLMQRETIRWWSTDGRFRRK